MSITQIGSNSSKMPLPEPNSDRPIMFWSTLVNTITDVFQFTLDNNIKFPIPNDPKSPPRYAQCRAMNISVDLTIIGGNRIVYMSESMIPCTYIVNYSGIHPVIHYGIISVGGGIIELQSGT